MSDTEPRYAEWAERFRSAYDRRESAFFVLHDNVADLFPLDGGYVPCRAYLEAMLSRGDYVTIHYDVSRGMRFFLVAALLWKFGEPIRVFVEQRLTLVTTVFVVLLVGGFVAAKFLI